MGEIKINPRFNVQNEYRKVNIVNPYRHGSGGGAPVGGVDPDYQAVLDFASNNAIPLPSSAQQDIDNQLMIDYKATGGWAKDDVFLKFNGTADPAFKAICWKRKIKTDVYGSISFSDNGAVGELSNTGYIDLKYNPSVDAVNYSLNSASVSWVTKEVAFGSLDSILSYYNGSLDSYSLIIPNNGSASRYNLNGGLFTVPQYDATGYNSVNRISSSQMQLNGLTPQTSQSGAVPSHSLYAFCRRRADTGSADYFSNHRLSFFTVGGDKSNEYAAIKTVLE